MARIIKIDRAQPESERIEEARSVLESGGLVIIPTETVYGIACNPSIPEAMKRLASAKGRDGNKPVARLASDPQAVAQAVKNWNSGLRALAAEYWPGPLTIVLETDEGWIGYRIPDHPVAQTLAQTCGYLLALTSANLSGESDTRTAEEAMEAIDADLILDSGPSAAEAVPSTVVRVDGDRIECLREGCIPFTTVEHVFNHRGTKSPQKSSL